MEHCHQADPRPEVLRIGRQLEQRPSRGAEQQAIEQPAIGQH
jgi:hypothetical protein